MKKKFYDCNEEDILKCDSLTKFLKDKTFGDISLKEIELMQVKNDFSPLFVFKADGVSNKHKTKEVVMIGVEQQDLDYMSSTNSFDIEFDKFPGMESYKRWTKVKVKQIGERVLEGV